MWAGHAVYSLGLGQQDRRYELQGTPGIDPCGQQPQKCGPTTACERPTAEDYSWLTAAGTGVEASLPEPRPLDGATSTVRDLQ